MLKQRIVATVIIKNGIVVQSIGFKKYLPVGDINITIEALNEWGIDEIIVLDIDATKENRIVNPSIVKSLSKYAMVPISIGGGISKSSDINQLLHSGADKVCINQSFLKNPSLIEEAVDIFGSQCIIVSLDIIKKNNEYFVYDYIKRESKEKMTTVIKKAQELGAGEIFINSVDNDGMKCGFNLEMINYACEVSTVPIIAQGGAENASNFEDAIKIKNISALAASNLFHFTEHSVTLVKSFLKKDIQYPVRLESHIKYARNKFDTYGRLCKKTDEELESLMINTKKKGQHDIL